MGQRVSKPWQAFRNSLLQMPSTGTLGNTLSLGPKNLKVKCQAFTYDGSKGWNSTHQPAHLSWMTIKELETRVQLDVASSSEHFLVDTQGYLFCPDLLLWSFLPAKLYNFGYYRKNHYKKDSPKHFFVAGMDRYYPISFWWSLNAPLPC